MSNSTAELEVAIAPAIAAAGAELVDLELRSNLLQVTIERAEGLDLETLAETARAISGLLDAREDLAPLGAYELEVTSPGVERRLRRPEHFQRVQGSLVALRTMPGTPGDRRIEGELIEADQDGVVLRLATGGNIDVRLSYEQIERAHTVFDWKAALAEAKASKGGARPEALGDDSSPAPASVTPPARRAEDARVGAITPKREQRP